MLLLLVYISIHSGIKLNIKEQGYYFKESNGISYKKKSSFNSLKTITKTMEVLLKLNQIEKVFLYENLWEEIGGSYKCFYNFD